MPRRTVVSAASAAIAALVVGALVGCSALAPASTEPTIVVAGDLTLDAAALWDASVVHDIAIDVDDAAVQQAIDTYLDSGEKVWIEATVVIDRVEFERVGVAADLIEQWTTTLTTGAGPLVSAETVEAEAGSIAEALGIR